MTAHFTADGLDHSQVKSEDELPIETTWSEEHDCVPLKQRLKMLRAKAISRNREEILISNVSPIEDVVKKEDDLCDSVGSHSDQDGSEGRSDSASCEQSQHGTVCGVETFFQDRKMSERLEIECTDSQYDSVTQLPNCQDSSSADDIEISEVFLEDLDDVVLKERQRMLLSRELVRSIGSAMEHNLSDPSTNLVDKILQNAGIESEGSDVCGIKSAIGGNDILEESNGNVNSSCEALKSDLLKGNQGIALFESRKHKNVSGESNESELALPPSNVKVEPLDELQILNKDSLYSQHLGNQMYVKSEHASSAEIYEEIIDHMLLGDRMRLLASRNFSKTILYDKYENSKLFVPSGNDHKPTLSESSRPLLMKRPCKRRKTVTDSVETALEEDAPGLLQVLIEKGVLVDEIKLYGETEGDEALDESLIQESFSELEDVITKIFSQKQSFFKFPPVRCARGEKTSYCLACLISLVEQARYLRFKKWPVEWGWCRDLQSFIFVFERHNRIVLERPEYGYATYFFELVDALPVHWQIKRLVTAMKLTSCSRITLIENRALTVGDDLTEGEARVLMEYGWIPDSGLGTMLNYRDRVVHDRKNEFDSDSSDWRSKIGKLLTDGYNGGTIVQSDIPKKVMEYGGVGQTHQIKLEQ